MKQRNKTHAQAGIYKMTRLILVFVQLVTALGSASMITYLSSPQVAQAVLPTVNPTINASPDAVSFGSVSVGATSLTQTIVIANIANSGPTVTSDGYTTCAVTTSGGVKCWGWNGYGQLGDGTNYNRTAPTSVIGLTSNVVSVQNGYYHTCALTASGGVKCWGYNGWGNLGDGSRTTRNTPVDVSGLTSGVIAIAVGHHHTCALTNKGAVMCWGWNGYGQLGDATTTEHHVPTVVNGFTTGASAIATGAYHTCAIATTGGVKCWGYGGEGQLGDGANSVNRTPVDVIGLTSGVKEIAAGHRWACAVTTAGAAKCWGQNSNGQLGNGSTTNSNVPVSVSGLSSGVSSLDGGLHHTCALMTSGGVKCWGWNGFGQLGIGSSSGNVTAPVDVSGLTSGAGSIATGYYNSCAALINNAVKCWGYNGYGQLGDGTTQERQAPVFTDGTPALFATPDLKAATAGGLTTCAITSGGAAKCWGYGAYGQLGRGTYVHNSEAPMDVVGLSSGVTQIANNYFHTCAIHNGAAKCWGYNAYGQLGNGSTTSSDTPVQVSGLTSGVTAIAVGEHSTCAVHNGAAKCWGWGGYGQLGNGGTSNNSAPVQVSGLTSGVSTVGAGHYHACAALTAGGMKCWGWNANGQLGNGGTSGVNAAPIDVSGFSSTVITQISADWEHTCALTAAGGAKCWGYNGNGQIGNGGQGGNNPTPVDVSGLSTGVAAIDTGVHHTCALMTSGGVKCWGYNGNGQVGDNSNNQRNVATDVYNLTSGATAVSAGRYHSCAVISDGNTRCWGYNGQGQLGDGANFQQYKPGLVSTLFADTPGPVAALSITAMSLSGVNAGDFTIVSGGTCSTSFPFTLAQGASCTVLVKANPTGTGTRKANLSISSNDSAQATINIPFDVTTSDPDIDVSPSSLNFGNVNLGVMSPSQFITIRNVAPAGGAMAAHPDSRHTCAVTDKGGVKCWGENGNGQLGIGVTGNRHAPVDVNGLVTGTTVVAVGSDHTCALVNNGVKCWGQNAQGQLGDGTTTQRLAPIDVSGLTSGVNAIAGGGNYTCALLNNGGMKCWGQNGNGQLGNGSTTQSNVPVDVSGLTSGVAAIDAGENHTCALLSTGGLKCWGNNAYGMLGNGSTTQSTVPVDVSGLTSGVSAVTNGAFHTCAILSSGGVKCWGYGAEGQLGNNANTQQTVSVDVSSLSSGVKAIDAGYRHTCALLTSGGLKCWGYGAFGQLGDGGSANRNVPGDVISMTTGVGDIATGQYHTCATLNTGGGMCWGYNAQGQLGDGTTRQRPERVEVSGQPNLFDTTSINAAAAGGYGTCGLTTDKGLKCWGFDEYHQTGDFDGFSDNRWAPVDVYGLISGTQQVVRNRYHACAVLADGSMKCWGYNGEGQLGDGSATSRQAPTDVSGFGSGSGGSIIDISGGYQSTCALLSSGGIKCFGWNAYGQLGEGSTNNRSAPTPVTGIASGATKVENGVYHTCAIVSGAAKCWGYNGEGQVGDGSNGQRLTQVQVLGLTSGVTDIATGERHTCAVVSGGAKCWGWNPYGQLGDGSTTNRNSPVDVIGLTSGVVDITVSDISSCALLTTGAVKCWGYGGEGQLGNGGTSSSSTPVNVSGMSSGIAAVEGSEYRHFCALTTGGGMQCWGYGGYGNLGNGGTNNSSVPVQVSGLITGVTAMKAGRIHTCAIASGGMKCWGWNGYGQLGDGSTTQRNVPTDVSGLTSGVTKMAAGEYYSCAIVSGAAKCWGYNGNGQLGDGSTTQRDLPTNVAIAVSGVAYASVGERHTCAVTTDGALKCWGWNANGQLGDGSTTNRTAPVQVTGLVTNAVSVATGQNFTCALLDTGGVKCWGSGANGRLGNGGTSQTPTPTDVSGLTSGVSAITAGSDHACATLTAGGVKCWGYNSNGQLGNGGTTQSLVPVDVSGTSGTVFTSVRAGYLHTCGLTSGGGMKCWGYNANGQLGNGNTTQSTVPVDVSGLTSGVTSIATAWYHSCAILDTGYMKCWGYNAEGELGDGHNSQRTVASTNVANLINGVAAAIGALTVSGIDVVTGNADQFAIASGGTCSSSLPFALAAGAGCTVAVKFAPTSYGFKESAVRVNSNDPLSPTIYVSLTGTGVGPEFDISKFGPASAVQGTAFNYQIQITNTGNSASNGTITVTDSLPADMSYVSGSGGGFTCAAGGQAITCTRTSAMVISGTATINFSVNTSAPGLFVNTANVIGGGDPTMAGSEAANTLVGSPPPDLTLSFGQPAPNLVANATSTMPVTVTNIGTGPTAGPISVTLNLPAGVSASAIFTDGTWTCNTISQTVNCSQPNSLLASEFFTFSVPIVPDFSRINTQPTITGTVQTTPETVTNNNNASMTASVPVAAPPTDVGIAKSVAPGTVTTGGAVVYTLNISNTTGVTATNVVVTDAIPAGLTGLSASNTFTTNNPTLSAGSTATWNLGMIGPNGTGSITISATAPAAGTITNTTGITATNDITPSNNYASAPLVVTLGGTSILVNTTADNVTAGDSNCTLREAITNANANSDTTGGDCLAGSAAITDTIAFSITGAGPHIIQPTSALPLLAGNVKIDGETQLGATCGPTRNLLIALSGASAGSVDGLATVTGAANFTIRGMAIYSFTSKAAIYIDGGAVNGVNTNAVIECNNIGTNVTGLVKRSNDTGVSLWGANNNRVGTNGDGVNDASERNIIVGNTNRGIDNEFYASNNVIAGNYIGLGVDGSTVIANGTGVFIAGSAKNNLVGTNGDGANDANERNVISGNGNGVDIGGGNVMTNVVAGNYIGTDATGALARGNTGYGVDIYAGPTNNRIGGNGATQSNLIAFNSAGVVVENASTNNAILGNSIYSNTNLGIDLGANGVTANDAGDPDSGPNGLLNFPVIQSVSGTTVNLNSDVPAGNYLLQIYDNPLGKDPSGYGEGQTLVYSGTVAITSGGMNHSATLAAAPSNSGQRLAATLTQDLGSGSYGSTSEFGNQVVTVLPDLTTAIGQPSPAFVAGSPSNVPITVTNAVTAGATTGPITTTFTLPNANFSAPASFTSTGNSCTTSGQVVTCVNPGPIAPGGNNVIQVSVTPNASAVGTQPAFNGTTTTPGETNTSNNAALPMTPSVAVANRANLNLIRNPGFQRDLSFWTASGTVGYGYGGSAAFNGANATPNGILTQSFQTNGGQTYPLSFVVSKIDSNSGGCLVGTVRAKYEVLDSSNSTILTGQGGTNVCFDQVLITNSFVSPGGIITLRLTDLTDIGGNGFDMRLDDVQVLDTTKFVPTGTVNNNPDFQRDLSAWATSGNVDWAYAGTAAFNRGNSPPNGVISQTIQTVLGVPYELSYVISKISVGVGTAKATFEIVNANNVMVKTGFVGQNNAYASALLTDTFTGTGGPLTLRIIDSSDSGGGNFDLLVDDVQINVVAPPPTITAPITGSVTNTTPVISGTATADSTVAVYEGGNLVCAATASATGSWSCTPTTPLSVGSHTITATAAFGNAISPASAPVSFTVNTAAPDLTTTIGQPSPNLVSSSPSNIPVTVTNSGTAPTTEPITTTMTLPAGMSAPATFSNNGWTCATSGQTVTCTNPSPIANGGNSFFTVPATPNASTIGSTPTFSATTAPTAGETVTANNGPASMTPTVAVVAGPTPDLTTAIGQPTTPFVAGSASNVPVTVTNAGTGPTTGSITTTMTLPTGTTAPAGFSNNGWSCATAGQTVTCTNPGPIAVAGSSAFTVTVTPDNTTVGTQPVINATTQPTAGETNTANNAAAPMTPNTAVAAAPAPDLTTTIGQPAPAFVAGTASNVPITVSNVGNLPTTGPITTSMTLPIGTSAPASFSSGTWNCTTSGNTVTCINPGPIAAASSSTIQVPVTANASTVGTTPGPFTGSTAPVPGETNTGNNTAAPMTPTTAVAPAPVPPVAPTINNPTNGSSITNTQPAISGIGTPGALITVTESPTGTVLCSTTVGAGSLWSCTPSTPLSAGSHTVSAVASNGNGSSPASAPVTFTVDTVPPAAPAITSPAASSTVNDNTPLFSGTGEPGSTVVVKEGAATVCSAIVDGSGNWSCTPSSAMTDGPHSITASSTDPAGNVGPASPARPFTVATLADLTTTIGNPQPALQATVPSTLPVTVNNIGVAPTAGPVTTTISLPPGVTSPPTFTSGPWNCTATTPPDAFTVSSATCVSNTPIPAGGSSTINVPITPDPARVGSSPTFNAAAAGGGEANTSNNAATPLSSGPVLPAIRTLPIKLFLHGPFQSATGIMSDGLRLRNLIPTAEPYAGLGFARAGGMSETTTSGVLAVSGSSAVVDWVLVELRDASNPATLITTRAALLLRNGFVKDVDGTSDLTFSGLTQSSYFVSVRHRNHLGAMTTSPVVLSASTAMQDFTTMPTGQVHGTNARRTVGSVYTLWAGNANGDGKTQAAGASNDLSAIVSLVLNPANGNTNLVRNYKVSGYRTTDVNMDGDTVAAGASNDVAQVVNNVTANPVNQPGLNRNVTVDQRLP